MKDTDEQEVAKVLVRMPARLHRYLARWADREFRSTNSLIVDILSRTAEEETTRRENLRLELRYKETILNET